MSTVIFLSASVPLPPPHRHERYYATADVIAIRDAIRALVTAVMPTGRLVFGGHPAITPMIRFIISNMNLSAREHITLFQSRFFQAHFPPENEDFEKMILVDAVDNDREASLAKMREIMIRSERFDAGVFVGGMEGVEEEYEMFRLILPRTPAYPIASTGAAARVLYDRYAHDRPELATDLRYLYLFRKLLDLHPQ